MTAHPESESKGSSLGILSLLFLGSGFAALVYQVVWQRALYTLYGVNIESVTVVVTAFMLGLGLGSLVGGVVSKNPKVPVVLAFAIVEASIGVFGVFSLVLFKSVGSATLLMSPPAIALITFLLVLIPTMLMGSTLPLLTAHFARSWKNVGRSVGALYFINTLGSAAASVTAVFALLPALGQSGAVKVAAALNFSASIVAVVAWQMGKTAAAEAQAKTPPLPDLPAKGFRIVLALGAATGAVALSQEILWYRVFSFVSWSHPTIFGLLLGFYLFGIALGSHAARRICRNDAGGTSARRLLPLLILASVSLGFFVIPLVGWLAKSNWTPSFALVALSAGLMGAVLPLLAHLGVPPDNRAGQRLSYLYLANILGSTLGSLLTGFILMDHLSTRGISVLLAVVGMAMAAATIVTVGWEGKRRTTGLVAAGLTAFACVLGADAVYDQVYERMLYKERMMPDLRFKALVENRHGVIAVSPNDVVYGGGAYDGVFNVALTEDKNIVARPFMLPALHPNPRRVLVLGLSSGSWTQIVASFPTVESIDVVEINPGYLPLIAEHPIVASILTNPKIKINIDDARRWLRRHPDEKYDLIVTNTSIHWRALMSNLLSQEHLEIIRTHLAPGGIHLYNTTSSDEVYKTAITVFPYVLRIINAVAVSDSPIHFDRAKWEDLLANGTVEGKPILDPTDPKAAVAREKLLGLGKSLEDPTQWNALYAMEPRHSIVKRTEGRKVITDDNMACEVKYPFAIPLTFKN